MLELDNPTRICNKRRFYLLYKTNYRRYNGILPGINDYCSRHNFQPFLKKMNDDAVSNPGSAFIFLTTQCSIFFCILLLYHIFIASYMNLFEFYSIFFTQLLIHVIYYLPPLQMFCVHYWLRTRAIYSAMPTLYPQAIEAYEVSMHFVYQI